MKNYNELFELAKDLHSEAKSDKDVKSLELIERLFPQLKETEEEKTLADLKKLVYVRADSRDLERFTNFLNRATPVFTDKEESFCEHILPRIVNNPFEWSPEQRSADLEYLKEFIDDIKGRFSLKKDDTNISMKETISNDKVLNTMLEHFKAKTKREWCGLNVSEIIDWLEKQKEQKPNIVEKLREISTPAKEDWFEIEKKWETEDNEDLRSFISVKFASNAKVIDGKRFAVFTWEKFKDVALDFVNRGKEQKSAERVEINKSLSDAVITELGKYNDENYCKSPWAIDSTGLQYPLYFANLGATWQKEQEQEVSINIREMVETYRVTDEYDDNGNLKGKPVNCMVRAYEQGIRDILKIVKQRPSEKSEIPTNSVWSEEDLYCRNQLIVFCENCMQQDSAAKRCANWLKSIRPQPHWKPTEEQMEALWNLMHYAVNLCSWPELEKSIESLYKDLKKL